MLDKKTVYRALEQIEEDIYDPDRIRNAIAMIHCELRNEAPPEDCRAAVKRALVAERQRVVEICEDPLWVDGLRISERIREAEL